MSQNKPFDLESGIQSYIASLRRKGIEPGQLAELEAHVSDTVDELLIRGFNEEQALKEACKRTGNPDSIAKQEWKMNGKRPRNSRMPMLIPVYLTQAWRQLRRTRFHSMITLIGLILGLTGCSLLAIYVHFEQSYDSFHPEAESIYRVYEKRIRQGTLTESLMSPIGLAHNLNNSISSIEAATAFHINEPLFSTNALKKFKLKALAADSLFNDVFHFPLLNGVNIPEPDPSGVFITQRTATRLFGESDPIGQAITWHNYPDRDMIVRGVLADVPGNSHFEFDIVIPTSVADRFTVGSVNWNASNGAKAYIKLTVGTDSARIVESLHAFQSANGGDTSSYKLAVMPLLDIHLNSNLNYEFKVNGNQRTIYLFSVISMLILVIACVNYAMITLAHQARRVREMGMRKILGANKMSITLQFLTESVLQLIIIIPLAILLTAFLLPEFGQIMNRDFEPLFPTYIPILGLTSGAVALFVLIACTYPAILLFANNTMESLKGNIIDKQSSGWLQKGSVAIQFAITAFLVIYMGGILLQMDYIRNTKLGYDPQHIMHIPIDNRNSSKVLKSQLSSIPGVQSVTVTNWLPGKTSASRMFPHPSGEGVVTMKAINGDEDLFRTLGINVVEGRNFDPSNPADTLDLSSNGFNMNNLSKYPVIINHRTIDVLGLEGPILGTEYNDLIHGRVIGIIDDIKFFSLHEAVIPMWIGYSDRAFGLLLKYDPSNHSEVRVEVERVYQEVTGGNVLTILYLDDVISELYEADSREASLIVAAVFLAIVLSVMGLLGMVVFSLELRTKEIGIRKVLGATMTQITWILTRRYIVLVIIGSIISIPIARYVLNDWLTSFAYRIDPGIGLYAVAISFTVVIAWIVIGLQSTRAAIANPVESLRSE